MSYKLPLAFIALAIVMLVGCKQPVGVPNYDAHTASTTTYCTATDNESYSGHVDWYKGVMPIYDYYERYSPMITRGYDFYSEEQANRAYPRKNGFCIFDVPYFETAETPTCTLFYWQYAHSGFPGLVVTYADQISSWPCNDNTLFWAAWNGDPTIAEDSTHTDNGWCAVPLTEDGNLLVWGNAGSSLITGWICPDSVDGTYTAVWGATNDSPPYIKVVYD